MSLLITVDISRKTHLKSGGVGYNRDGWHTWRGVSGKFTGGSQKFRRDPHVKTDTVTRELNFLTRPSWDEFYDHTGFTCWIQFVSRKCQLWSVIKSDIFYLPLSVVTEYLAGIDSALWINIHQIPYDYHHCPSRKLIAVNFSPTQSHFKIKESCARAYYSNSTCTFGGQNKYPMWCAVRLSHIVVTVGENKWP